MTHSLAKITTTFAVFLLVGLSSAWAVSPEAPQDVRNKAALETLKANPNVVMLYAKGLCCMSCAIGVRKKVGPLDFVDKARFNQGIQLDPKTQLVTVAVTPGKHVSAMALRHALDSAGYDPVHMYRLKGGKLVTKSIAIK